MNTFQFIIIVLVAFFGLSVGSFLNVVVLRFDDIESIIKTRSRCPHCKKNLPWYDLVPFFSYIILAGRCRVCKKTISIQYPIVEAVTALIFVLIYWQYGLSIEGTLLATISSLLIVVATYDWLHLEIPDILIYSAAIFASGLIVYSLWQIQSLPDLNSWLTYIYGLLIGVGFFGFLVVVSKQKWMGVGDVLLAGLMGLILGYPNIIVALFLAFLLGSLFSLVLMATKKKTLKDAVPFGPFLVLATFIALFWGNNLLNIYLLRFGL
jgi:leader peptidase (prepilin peptidase)/N-methyltransferase